MIYKTLVTQKGTKYQEFFGYEHTVGWVTSDRPISIFNKDITMEQIKNNFPNVYLKGVELVTIEINIID